MMALLDQGRPGLKIQVRVNQGGTLGEAQGR